MKHSLMLIVLFVWFFFLGFACGDARGSTLVLGGGSWNNLVFPPDVDQGKYFRLISACDDIVDLALPGANVETLFRDWEVYRDAILAPEGAVHLVLQVTFNDRHRNPAAVQWQLDFWITEALALRPDLTITQPSYSLWLNEHFVRTEVLDPRVEVVDLSPLDPLMTLRPDGIHLDDASYANRVLALYAFHGLLYQFEAAHCWWTP